MFGIALATAILPSLSRNFASDDGETFAATLDWAMRLVVLIAVPASLGLGLLAGPLVTTLFFGGLFDAFDVQMARASLWTFSGGLLAFMSIKVLAPGYFARQDMKTPVRIALIALAVNLVCNLLFIAVLIKLEVEATHAGLTLATTVSAFVNAGLLFRGLRRDGRMASMPGWVVYLARVVIAALAMTAFLVAMSPTLEWWLAAGVGNQVLQLTLLIAAGAAIYFGVLFASGLRLGHLKLSAATRRVTGGDED